jgi:hypothetical protein
MSRQALNRRLSSEVVMRFLKGWRSPAVVAGALLLLAPHGKADTNISGNITTSTTWTTAGSPYIVTGVVYVEGWSGPVLTIQPGVTVKFNSGAGIVVNYGNTGALQALGTSGQPILFTSVNPAAGPRDGFRERWKIASRTSSRAAWKLSGSATETHRMA